MKQMNAINEIPFDFEKKAIEYLDTMGMTKSLNESQKKLFIELAVSYSLNPFKREIYPITYKDKWGATNLSIVTGYEVYINRANRSGLLNGWKWKTEGNIVFKDEYRRTQNNKDYIAKVIDRDKSTLKAVVTIHRKDWSYPFVHSITVNEFCGEGPIWTSSPTFMLRKTAASQAFRICFTEELAGLPYTQDETSTFKDIIDAPVVEGQEMPEIEAPASEIPAKTEELPVQDNTPIIPTQEPEPVQPNEGINIETRTCQLAEKLFQNKFLTDKKRDSIISKINDSDTGIGLKKYLFKQVELLQKLYEISNSINLETTIKADIYKSILSAKSNDFANIESILNGLTISKVA